MRRQVHRRNADDERRARRGIADRSGGRPSLLTRRWSGGRAAGISLSPARSCNKRMPMSRLPRVTAGSSTRALMTRSNCRSVTRGVGRPARQQGRRSAKKSRRETRSWSAPPYDFYGGMMRRVQVPQGAKIGQPPAHDKNSDSAPHAPGGASNPQPLCSHLRVENAPHEHLNGRQISSVPRNVPAS